MNKCEICKAIEAKFRCGKCLNVYYCSKDCQFKDWKKHREYCGKSLEDIQNKREAESSLSCNDLEAFTAMTNSVLKLNPNSDINDLIALYDRAPDLALEFSEYLKLNATNDILVQKSLKLLKQETMECKALYMHELAFFLPTESELHPSLNDPQVLMKLVNSNDLEKMKWYLTSAPNQVYVSPVQPRNYIDVFHSFSNFVPNIEQYHYGETFVAVGFVDLSILLHGNVVQSEETRPLRFIGYESCAFNVAKTLVINSMLKRNDDCIVDAILQVWYSSCWNKSTLDCFSESLNEAIKLCNHKEVLDILNYWKESEVPSIEMARREWMEKIDSFILSPVTNCITDYRCSMSHYFLTGQLLDASFGSVVMFQLRGRWKANRSRNESFFESLPQKELALKARENSGDFVMGGISLLRENIRKLNHEVRNGKVLIEICSPNVVSLENKPVIDAIKSSNPDWISWNNCLDYMTMADFHKLARLCSGPCNTIHLGYSMNWICDVSMNSFLAWPVGDHVKEAIKMARDSLKLLYVVTGFDGLILHPPITNPINILDYALRIVTYHDWTRVFFKSVPKLIKAEKVSYSPFLRTSDAIVMAWTYDENIKIDYRYK